MFGKDQPATGRAESRTGSPITLASDTPPSVIAASMRIVGDLESSGIVKIDGRVDGSITHAKQVLLGRGATIMGNVLADEVIVGGTVDGGIRAADRLELQASAIVNGDIETKSIVVLEGARINGSVRMTDGATAKAEPVRVASDLRVVTGA
jgi:cytoskeletal protein CcmA (bactofilin family)